MRFLVSSNAGIVTAFSLALVLAACGGESPEVVVKPGGDGKNFGEVFKVLRRDPTLGEGGWFKFKFESKDYQTEYGYADFHPSVGGKSRLVFLSKPVEKGELPALRIVLFADFKTVEEYEGQTLAQQVIKLKLVKQKGSKAMVGNAKVTIEKVESGWIEGKFNGVFGRKSEEKKISGSFRASVNIPEGLVTEAG